MLSARTGLRSDGRHRRRGSARGGHRRLELGRGLVERLAERALLRDYEVDLEDLSAESVAAKVGMPPARVSLTLSR